MSEVKCSKCGSRNVSQTNDKTRILSYASHIPLYAKKFVCNGCGNEWV
jgi:ribosomal protein S27E